MMKPLPFGAEMSEQIHALFRWFAAFAVRTGVHARIRVAGLPVAVVVVALALLAACSDGRSRIACSRFRALTRGS